MLKVLVIDQIGLSLDFCMRCLDFGHEVRLWIKPSESNKHMAEVGDGYVPKVKDWRPSMNWADLIVTTDNSSLMEELAPYQRKGYPVFGSNVAGAKLELDRQFGQAVFKKAGIKIMESTEFNDYDKAIEFVKKNPQRWVCKPNGDVDKALSYVSESPRDMIFMLERWKKENPQNQGFVLQPFKKGVEIAIGGWFGAKGWSKHFLTNFEFKKLLPGDHGPNTGEQGTVMKYSEDSKLADKLLIPLTSYLHSINYRGYFDMAAMVDVDEDGTPWPLEATSRPGWPCEIIAQALHVGDPAQWMLDLMNGEDTLEVLDEIAVGVVVTIGDYPFTQYTKRDFSGYPVYDTEPLLLEDIHLCEVKLGKAPDDEGNLVPTPVTCGDYVLVATGTDYSVKGAQMRANRAMKKVEIPLSPGWRDDIGERIKDQLPRLREHDYVPDWKY
jgi:phosphoribosylamine---glycine ligase